MALGNFTRIIRQSVPNKDGRSNVEVEFTIDSTMDVKRYRVMSVPGSTDLNALAASLELTLEESFKEQDWRRARTEARNGRNPIRAAMIYSYTTKREIAQRLIDKLDPDAVEAQANLTRIQTITNRLTLFLSTE